MNTDNAYDHQYGGRVDSDALIREKAARFDTMVRERAAKFGSLVRFDWAIKRLLRQKTDFVVVNGFLTSLLGRRVSIIRALESEGNARTANSRINRVDMLVEDESGQKYIIEVQTTSEVDFFHRMVFGASKVVTDYIGRGDEYGEVVKVYSVNILYFSLGQGEDFAYHGTTEFRGMFKDDVLQLSQAQRRSFGIDAVGDIFPEYFVLRVNDFDGLASTPLSEWIYFLKNSAIPQEFTAPGLEEARDLLAYDNLPPGDRVAYDTYIKDRLYDKGVYDHYRIEGLIEGQELGIAQGLEQGLKQGIEQGIEQGLEQGLEQGREQGREQGLEQGREQGRVDALRLTAQALKKAGVDVEIIIKSTGLTAADISAIEQECT